MIRMIRDNVEILVEDDAVEKKTKEGYKAINQSGEVAETNQSVNKPLKQMKVDELRALAAEHEIESYTSLNKEELIAVLKDVI